MVTEYNDPFDCIFQEQDDVLNDLYTKLGWETGLTISTAFEKMDSWLFDQQFSEEDISFIAIRCALILGQRAQDLGYGQFKYIVNNGVGCICIIKGENIYDLIKLTNEYMRENSTNFRLSSLFEKTKELCVATQQNNS